ncbi:hypothetical protein DOTSEDRAFT_50484 [Dothistroma septosporum NZE10]|uniref:Uncharacterized protein n=1 Tax=Dothistroma septosporum (strain NZE10 / CBS 128990) TaxID=675120 RepID=N1PUB1_DOTSN|nr:hypothetical protein DOTSEDRAFT_50484 [Dothistroma septosporum NZE10]
MLEEPESYFPPADYWPIGQPIVNFKAKPEPLLPTPVSSRGAPSYNGSTCDRIHQEATISTQQSSQCSCPASDLCICETIGLLLGSSKLLHVAAEWHPSAFDGLSAYLCGAKTTPAFLSLSAGLSKLEDILYRILAVLSQTSDQVSSALILARWRFTSAPSYADDDICATVRRRLEGLGIAPVDLLPPLQHDLHMLLAWYDFSGEQFQAKLRSLKSKEQNPHIALLLEANQRLAQYTVRALSYGRAEMVQDLRAKIDELAKQMMLKDTFSAS